MAWTVLFHAELEPEFRQFPVAVQNELLALKGSSFPNMKELRFNADDGVWRFAFAFAPPNGRPLSSSAAIKQALTSARFTRN